MDRKTDTHMHKHTHIHTTENITYPHTRVVNNWKEGFSEQSPQESRTGKVIAVILTESDKNSWIESSSIISAVFKRRYGVDLRMSKRQGDFLHSAGLHRRAGLTELRLMNRKQIKHRCVTSRPRGRRGGGSPQ